MWETVESWFFCVLVVQGDLEFFTLCNGLRFHACPKWQIFFLKAE